MTAYRLLAGNASAVLAGRVLSIGVGVVLATVLFQALGAQRYGAWSLLTLISGYSTLVDFGLSAAIERRVAALIAGASAARIPATITTSIGVIVALACLAEMVAAALLASPLGRRVDADLRLALLILPICTALSLASLALGAVLAGQQRMGVLHLWRSVGLVLGSLAVVTALALEVRALAPLLLIYTAGSLVTLALVWRSVRSGLPGLQFGMRWDRDAFADLLSYGGVLQGATMVPPLAEYAFRLVVGARFGFEFAGIYDLGARAAIVPRSLAGALFSAMVPFAVQTEQQQGTAGLARLLRTTSRHVALFILPASAVLLAFADPLMRLWLGDTDAAMVGHVQRCFEVVLVGHALGALAVPAAMVARAVGRPRPEALAAALAFGSAVLAARFVPSFEMAAALLWILPAVGGFAVWWWLSRRLGSGFVNLGDASLAVLVSLVTYGVARALAGWDSGVPLVARLGVASIAAMLASVTVELASAERRAAARTMVFKSAAPR
jgi:O-antigen/teichoic acid export membrane protein